MKKKRLIKSSIFLLVFMMLMQMLETFTLTDKVFAEDVAENSFPFITDIALTDENGGESYDVNTKKFQKNENVRIECKFKIPNNQKIKSGQKYKIVIPKEFNVKDVKAASADVISENDNLTTTGAAATVKSSTDVKFDGIAIEQNKNELTVTFNEEKEENLSLSGKFYVEAAFNPEEIGNAVSKTISFFAHDESDCKSLNASLINNQSLAANNETVKKLTVKFAADDKENQFKFITGVYLSDEEFANNLAFNNAKFEDNYKNYLEDTLNKTEFAKDAQMFIGYTFEIPQNQKISAGEKFTLNVPDKFAKIIQNTDGIPLDGYDEDGVKINIGTVTYYTDNTVTIEFSDACSKHYSEVVGNFWLKRNFNERKIENTNPVPITFSTPYCDDKTFNFNFKQAPVKEIEPTITKTGEYLIQDQAINWKIVVDAGNIDRTNVSITDVLDTSKQKFKSNSLKVDGISVRDSYFSDNKLNYNIDKLASGQTKTIEFQTEPSSDILNHYGVTTEIPNTAALKMDGKAEKTCTATAKVENDFLYKNGAYNSSTKCIDWIIEVNKSQVNFINPIITDQLPENLALKKDTVKVDKKPIASDQVNYDGGSRIFKCSLPSDNMNHTIEFSTSIDESVLQQISSKTVSFKNSAKLDVRLNINSDPRSYTYNSTVDANDQNANDIITKEAIGYDNETKEITWKIVANTNKTEIKNAKIQEYIALNQKYVPNSIKCDEKPDIEVSQVEPEDESEYSDQYEISLGDIQDTCTITLKTKVIDNVSYGNKNTFCHNDCKLIGDNIESCPAEGKIEVNNTMIKKSGNYNCNTHEITWSITVNSSQNPIKDVQIIDAINSGQEYVDNSFSVERIDGKQDTELTPDAIKNGFSYTPNSTDDLKQGGRLSYSFGAKIKDSYKITFKTKVAYDSEFADNNNKTIQNKAQLKTSETNKVISDLATIKINNFMVKKDYEYLIENDFITWKVNMNSNNIPLNGMKITDTIPDGLQIDMDSVKLYEVQFDKNGNAINGSNNEVDSSQYNISYDFASRNFVLQYPNSTSKSYLLQFDTIVKYPGSSFPNSVMFEANNRTDTSETTSSKVQFSQDAYGGGASINTGRIVITKVDKDTNKTLSGAKFALMKNGNVIQVSEPTGADGIAVFKRLKFGTEYSVKELEAPNGYNLNKEEYKFSIAKGQYDHNVMNYTFADKKMGKNIELKKKTLNGDPLKGAEFILYLASDSKFQNPIETSTSDENGIVSFEDVDYGNYIIKEVNAPKGYILSSNEIKATVDVSKKVGDIIKTDPYEITNKCIKKTIQFSKKSGENLPLAGAEFALYKQNDMSFENPLKTVKSNENGIVSFEDIDYGNYIIKEVTAPQGYELSDELIHVSEDDFVKDENPIKTNPDTIIDKSASSTGIVIDNKGNAIHGIETKVTSEADKTETIFLKAQDAVLFKEPDGTKSSLTDFSKLSLSSIGNSNSNVEILPDGNIKIKDIKNGSEEKFNITYDLGNGQKIIIGTIDVKVSGNGDVSLISQLIDPYGVVTDSATGKVIEGAKITLYYADTDRNKASGKTPNTVVNIPEALGFKPNNNRNPQPSDSNGTYAFMVFPTSDYYIVAVKDGYNNYISPTIPVEYQVVKHDIKMDRLGGNSGSSSSSGKSKHSMDQNQDPIKDENLQKGNSDTKPNASGSSTQNMNSINNSSNQMNSEDTNVATEVKKDSDYENSNLNNKTSNKLLPQSGSFVDFTVLTSFGILLILLGIAYRLRKKFLIK